MRPQQTDRQASKQPLQLPPAHTQSPGGAPTWCPTTTTTAKMAHQQRPNQPSTAPPPASACDRDGPVLYPPPQPPSCLRAARPAAARRGASGAPNRLPAHRNPAQAQAQAQVHALVGACHGHCCRPASAGVFAAAVGSPSGTHQPFPCMPVGTGKRWLGTWPPGARRARSCPETEASTVHSLAQEPTSLMIKAGQAVFCIHSLEL